MFIAVLTVTVSPGAKNLEGMKLPPCPSECGCTTPVCTPLLEPITWSADAAGI